MYSSGQATHLFPMPFTWTVLYPVTDNVQAYDNAVTFADIFEWCDMVTV